MKDPTLKHLVRILAAQLLGIIVGMAAFFIGYAILGGSYIGVTVSEVTRGEALPIIALYFALFSIPGGLGLVLSHWRPGWNTAFLLGLSVLYCGAVALYAGLIAINGPSEIGHEPIFALISIFGIAGVVFQLVFWVFRRKA